jgi:hypothetical protein
MTRIRIALVVAAVAVVALGAWLLWSPDREARSAPFVAPAAAEIDSIPPVLAKPPEPARVETVIAELDESSVRSDGTAPIVASALRATVSDRAGAPVPDASVFVFPLSGDPMRAPAEYVARLRELDAATVDSPGDVRRQRTDGAGAVDFPVLPEGDRLGVAAFHPQHGCSTVERSDPAAGGRDVVALTVAPPIRLRVRVVDDAGAPMAEASLDFFVGERSGGIMSVHIPLDVSGRAEAELWRAERIEAYASCHGYRGAGSGPIELEDHEVERSIELRLVALDLVTVRGRLAFADGQPEESVGDWLRATLQPGELAFAPPSGPGVLSTILDLRERAVGEGWMRATGRLDLEGDSFEIDVIGEDDRTVIALVARNTVLGWIERDAATDSFPDDADLLVDPSRLPSSSELGAIRVRVVAADDGVVLDTQDVLVWAWGAPGSSQVRKSARFGDPATSGLDGLLEFDELPFGIYHVGAKAPGRAARVEEIDVDPGAPSREVTIELACADATLRGVLKAPDGARSGAAILCYEVTPSGWTPFPSATNLDARSGSSFVFSDLPRRRLAVVSFVEECAPAWAEVDLSEGDAEIELTPAGGESVSIQGVPDRPFDSGCDDASVRIVDEAGRVVVDWAHPYFFRTCSHGWARVTLARGRYTATLFVTEHEPGSADFTVEGPTQVRIPLRRRPR